MAAGAPVNQISSPINEPFSIEADKDFLNSAGETGIERESLSGPVAGAAEFF